MKTSEMVKEFLINSEKNCGCNYCSKIVGCTEDEYVDKLELVNECFSCIAMHVVQYLEDLERVTKM